MRLDVIIPCAGAGQFIGETLERIGRQGRMPDAIYLVDNASSHSVYREAAEKCALPNVRYVRFSERLPMTQNWQRCLGVGDGELCLMLHDDDLPIDGAFEAAAGVLEADPGLTCALLPPVYLEPGVDDEEAERRRVLEKFAWIDSLAEPARSFFLSTGGVNHMSALMFRRGPWGFFPHLRWMPDQGFLFLHAVQGRVALVRDGGTLIRRHGASLTSSVFAENGRTMSEERLHLRTAIEVFLEDKGLAAAHLLPIASRGIPYYLKRLLQACFSWPWRRGRLRLGREIIRTPAFKDSIRAQLRMGAVAPALASTLTGVASDLRYFCTEKCSSKG